MDTKNVIAAISLSAAVIILYSLFWAPSPQELKEANEERNKVIETTEAPSLEVEEKVLEISSGTRFLVRRIRKIENRSRKAK